MQPFSVRVLCSSQAISHGAVRFVIKAHLGLTDEEPVEQIKEKSLSPDLIGLEGYQYLAPCDPSMIVYFRKRLSELAVNDCNERIMLYGLNVIRSSASTDHVDDSCHGGGSSCQVDQQNGTNRTEPHQSS